MRRLTNSFAAVIAVVALLVLLPGRSKAADSTVSAMSAASALSGAELIYCVQSGGDTKCTPAQIATYIEGLLSGGCTIVSNVVYCTVAHPGFVASNWYVPGPPLQMATGSAMSANVIRCYAGYVSRKITISQLAARMTTPGTNVQFAIYTSSGGRPGALVAATANIDVSGAAGTKSGALLANKQIGPGGADADRDLWFCSNVDNASTVMLGGSNVSTAQAVMAGTATLANLLGSTVSVTGISCSAAACQPGSSSTLGTWPASLVGSTWTDLTIVNMPIIAMFAVSVP